MATRQQTIMQRNRTGFGSGRNRRAVGDPAWQDLKISQLAQQGAQGMAKAKAFQQQYPDASRGRGDIGFSADPSNLGIPYVPGTPGITGTSNLAGTPGAGTGGTATTAGAGGAAGNIGDLGAPFTGFASPFAPSAAPQIFDNPQILLMQAMKNMGYDPSANQGLYQMALPGADYANALAMIALGGQPGGFGAGGNNAAINFMGNYLQQGVTPGGQAIDFNQGLSALNAGQQSAQSPLGMFLNSNDPSTQISRYQSLALPLAAASLHPLFARAFQNAINQSGDQYLYNMSGPNVGVGTGGFGGYFANNVLGG